MTRFRSLDRPAYAVAATALSAIVLAGPAGAAAPDVTQGHGGGTAALRMLLAQADPTQATPAQERPEPQAHPGQAAAKRPNARRVTIHNVDEWIAYLQDQLHITPAETAQWNAVAQVMRDNAESVHRLVEERNQNQKAMNAVDDLRSYEQLTEAQVDGIKRLLPAFETLYADMSDDQKKNADTVFSSFERPGAQKRKSS
jgi:periplasmic protein CpxP/Spy